MVIEKQMEKNDELTGLELQKLLQKEVDGFDASLGLSTRSLESGLNAH